MSSPMDAYADLIGKTVWIENADNDMLNVVDTTTAKRYWIESTGRLLVFSRENESDPCECGDGGHDTGISICMCGGRIAR